MRLLDGLEGDEYDSPVLGVGGPLIDFNTGFVGRRAAAKKIQAEVRCYLVRLRIKGTRAQHAAAERIQRWVRRFLEECHAWRATNRQLLTLLLNRVRILLPFTSVNRNMEVLRTATHLGRRAKPSTETLSRVAASDLVVLSTPAILRGTLPHNRFLQRAGLSSAQLLATQIVTNTALIQPRWSASASASGEVSFGWLRGSVSRSIFASACDCIFSF